MALSGKRLVFILFGALLLLTVLYIGGSATLVKSKADVCRGFVAAEEQARCSATATAGRPPNYIRYH